MATFQYPVSDLDRAEQLLALLGSYWSNTFAGSDLVQDILFARGQLDSQAYLDFLDLIASMSRFTVPIFHRENWHLLTFLQSEVDQSPVLLATYADGKTVLYTNANQLLYGEPQAIREVYSVPCPAELMDCPLILNRIAAPSLTLVKDVDYFLPEPGVICFRDNPFLSELVPTQPVFNPAGVQIDQQAGLWLYHGQWDWHTVYEQFGYALKLHLASSEGYRDLINAILDAMMEGTKLRDLHYALSAITGIPLVIETKEIVQVIEPDRRSLCVITDRHAYKFPLGSQPLVQVGQTVQGGDPLVDTLQFFEFGRGTAPAELSGLVLGPGLLSSKAGFWGDLTFDNKDVPLTVEENVSGKTKVSFEIGGFPEDVKLFWDLTHMAGVIRGQTLANLLDKRKNPTTEPSAANLPATVNPLQFLCANYFRYHAIVAKVRVDLLGKNALGMWSAAVLKRIMPPEKALILLMELAHSDEPIIMEGPGTDTSPGYEEQVSGFPCMTASDTIDGSVMITERVRIFQIKGKCE
jgi:hypothetical protein